jgi:hypothetical protein
MRHGYERTCSSCPSADGSVNRIEVATVRESTASRFKSASFS